MAVALILEFEGVTADDYWAVNQKLGIDMVAGTGDYPEGLLAHGGGFSERGTLIVSEIWASREQQEAFMQARLGTALADAGVTAVPTLTWVELLAHQTFAS